MCTFCLISLSEYLQTRIPAFSDLQSGPRLGWGGGRGGGGGVDQTWTQLSACSPGSVPEIHFAETLSRQGNKRRVDVRQKIVFQSLGSPKRCTGNFYSKGQSIFVILLSLKLYSDNDYNVFYCGLYCVLLRSMLHRKCW